MSGLVGHTTPYVDYHGHEFEPPPRDGVTNEKEREFFGQLIVHEAWEKVPRRDGACHVT